MRKRIVLAMAFAAMAFILSSCAGSTPSNTNAAKPGSSNASTSNANGASKPQPKQPTTEIKNEKRPEGAETKNLPPDRKAPVPQNWVYYSDEVKGYGFWLPEGSVGDSTTQDGVDIFLAQTPAPAEVKVEVYAWKDRKLTKEELLKMTLDEMKKGGENVTASDLVGESADYALAEATSIDSDGKRYKMKILVGTDITDNYVMVVYTDEAKYEANKQIVDLIWGNFEMYSGGASGTS